MPKEKQRGSEATDLEASLAAAIRQAGSGGTANTEDDTLTGDQQLFLSLDAAARDSQNGIPDVSALNGDRHEAPTRVMTLPASLASLIANATVPDAPRPVPAQNSLDFDEAPTRLISLPQNISDLKSLTNAGSLTHPVPPTERASVEGQNEEARAEATPLESESPASLTHEAAANIEPVPPTAPARRLTSFTPEASAGGSSLSDSRTSDFPPFQTRRWRLWLVAPLVLAAAAAAGALAMKSQDHGTAPPAVDPGSMDPHRAASPP